MLIFPDGEPAPSAGADTWGAEGGGVRVDFATRGLDLEPRSVDLGHVGTKEKRKREEKIKWRTR